jgi:hypothetical protein
MLKLRHEAGDRPDPFQIYTDQVLIGAIPTGTILVLNQSLIPTDGTLTIGGGFPFLGGRPWEYPYFRPWEFPYFRARH